MSYCPHCGLGLPEPKTKCANCSCELEADFCFCPDCGFSVAEEPETDQPKSESPKSIQPTVKVKKKPSPKPKVTMSVRLGHAHFAWVESREKVGLSKSQTVAQVVYAGSGCWGGLVPEKLSSTRGNVNVFYQYLMELNDE